MKTTFKKLRNGRWGLIGPEGELKPGRRITVHKRNGAMKGVSVGKILWSGDGKAIATIGDPPRQRRQHYYHSSTDGGCHTDGNCSSMCASGSDCPCWDGSWYSCC